MTRCANPRCSTKRPGTVRRRPYLGFNLCVDCEWECSACVSRAPWPRDVRAIAQAWMAHQWKKGRQRPLIDEVKAPKG